MSKRRSRMGRKERKSIKDKALIKFICQHLEKEDIDPSKVAIPSPADVQKAEEEDSRAFRYMYCKSKSEGPNSEKVQTPPTFSLSLSDVIKMEVNSLPSFHFNSTLIQ